MKGLLKIFAAGALALGLSTPAKAAVIDLGFAIDESGSVSSSNYNLMKQGLAAALNQIPVSGPDTYRIGVVKFDNTAEVVLAPVVLTAANLASVQSTILGAGKQNGNTNPGAGINLLHSAFISAFGSLGDKSLINITTDGVPCCSGNEQAIAIAAANDARTAGWDSLSAEMVGSASTTELAQIVFPGPALITNDPTALSNPLTQSFILKVNSFDDYGNAIALKVQKVVTSTVPLPAAGWLLIAGIGGLAALRRRKTV